VCFWGIAMLPAAQHLPGYLYLSRQFLCVSESVTNDSNLQFLVIPVSPPVVRDDRLYPAMLCNTYSITYCYHGNVSPTKAICGLLYLFGSSGQVAYTLSDKVLLHLMSACADIGACCAATT
jgi:hypothetical protein